MDFDLTEEELFIKDAAKKFAAARLSFGAEGSDAQNSGKRTPSMESSAKELASLGFMGMNIQQQYGGAEVGVIAYALAIVEIARVCAATALTMSVTNMVAEVLQSVGNEDQKQKYLPLICSGEYSAGSFCLTESQAGSDPASMLTKGIKCDDGWRLTGTKQWITSATFAGLFVVWAVSDVTLGRGKGITCFIVEANRDGITVGPPQHKMGQHGSPTCDVHFEDVFVPNENILGAVNDGYRIAVRELTGGRIGIASLALGIGKAAMEYATRYAMQRIQFQQPIAQFQGIQWMIADRHTELDAAELLILRAATLKASGRPYAKEASMAKLFASEKANDACYTALQILGGYGYMKDFPVERYARDARITTIYEGTSEIQRLIISKNILAEYASL
jgi:alkylation response protein AidB-like acyl-CoA dehydrogenase